MKNVLIVEDEPEISDILRSYLKPFSDNVTTAADGLEALSLIENREFDLILSDMKMPRMEGIAFLQELVQKKGRGTPVILISGALDLNSLVKAVKLGVVDVIQKPFSHEEIIGSLSRLEMQSSRRLKMKMKDLNLTSRQLDILKGVLDGLSNKEISNIVSLTEQAVKYHIARFFKIFNVKSRKELKPAVLNLLDN